MASLDQLLKAFKRKMEESGITEIDNPDELANELFEVAKSRRLNVDTDMEADDDNIPIFSTSGDIIDPNEIDYNFETLDVCSGKSEKVHVCLYLW